ncbi:type II toxin-antitoxin system RelE/ParE family toxin [Turneriella parva]|uniref:Plasmid stabilization system n=1 Tax=Turneriella parva (strain ATCC BAA-1111 / DSM 21527 / NCTC 11395 / H) TaxID=869212 RepID=I4B9Y3_TURPD|nr:type II toxin-antitoxin system RelE/ParE family toxin [Turneriella parva]AFM14090.1 plasmid stabilization system [Turneriella parva DSM 21527]
MPKPIDIVGECVDEIAVAYETYEKISQELGMRFLDAIDRTLESLISNPEIGPVCHRGARKIVLTRFPFILYYIERPSNTQLIAFIHAKRDPRSIRTVLTERDYTSRT